MFLVWLTSDARSEILCRVLIGCNILISEKWTDVTIKTIDHWVKFIHGSSITSDELTAETMHGINWSTQKTELKAVHHIHEFSFECGITHRKCVTEAIQSTNSNSLLVCLPVCLFVSVSACLFVRQHIYLSLCLVYFLAIYVTYCQSSVCLLLCLSVCPSVGMSVYQ